MILMQLNSYELAVYTACLNGKKNLSEVAEYWYPDNSESVRTNISRAKALDSLLEKQLLIPRRDTKWKYVSDKSRAEAVLRQLGLPEEVVEAKKDSYEWVERVAERDKPKFQYFNRFLEDAILLDYLEQNRGLDKQDLELIRQLKA